MLRRPWPASVSSPIGMCNAVLPLRRSKIKAHDEHARLDGDEDEDLLIWVVFLRAAVVSGKEGRDAEFC